MDPLEFLGSSIDDFPEPASPGTVSGHDTDKVPKARNDSTSQWSKEQLNMSSLARFQHKWKRAGEDDSAYRHLIDLSQLHVIPKSVRPLEKQLHNESRKLWGDVTSKLLSKEYSEANRHKQTIEQKQRDDAAERKRKGVT